MAIIPSDCKISYKSPKTLSKWRSEASYNVLVANNRGFQMECSAIDLGEAIFSDVEYLLDHMAEQRATVYQSVCSKNWISPSWTLVTIYYWSFFAGLALTRLLGKPVLFLDKPSVDAMKNNAPIIPQGLGAGSFQMECGNFTSVTSRNVSLSRKNKTLHECVWNELSRELQRHFRQLNNQSSDQLEDRYFKCLLSGKLTCQPDWPSRIRNVANYRLGHSYKTVRRENSINLIKFIKESKMQNMETLINSYEEIILKLPTAFNLESDFNTYSEALFFNALLLSDFCEDLYSELLDRHGLDKRWRNNRLDFFKKMGMITNKEIWPFTKSA